MFVLFYLILLSFNMGFFSFCGTFFFICAVLFLFFAGHLHCHRALGKGQGTGFSVMKLNMQAQKNWQLFKIVCECLACLDRKFTVFSEFLSASEEFVIVHHIPSVGATKGCNKPLLMRLTFMSPLSYKILGGPCPIANSCYYLFVSQLGHRSLLFT